MKTAERIVLVAILLVCIGGAAWIYFAVQYEHQKVVDAVARGEYEIPLANEQADSTEDWRVYYPITTPIRIADTTGLASVADSLPERVKGLSDTPYLPDNLVKLFDFGAVG